ncbi:hypothetical protein PTTG_07625 [Puccinia triticina 1-1 BBBD Race 1]|uniref:Uncharacterized protein n=2 Tax=Puccinia triticina TaxID=208348 RepID=A0A0C4F3E6_PUCT1|nr:uncharacterized protein PtA15_17A185 [Puccinia triticina]OAV97261.1 hypothetical protein PTTG_07625 [Puccinia triticina 1-1 BBBD Race 1]WAQ92703.1 hypothetical protein PtA15_17A185 [Puccinia triticina]WAR63596.1 hypothetical protein PtB15_17B196 [Puccinia triticina]
MKITTLSIFAMLNAFSAATPAADFLQHLDRRAVNCGSIVPACFGGTIVGQTDCRCKGQVERCDLWTCPDASTKTMVCGQNRSGCVYI